MTPGRTRRIKCSNTRGRQMSCFLPGENNLNPQPLCDANHLKQEGVPMQGYLSMGVMSQQGISGWKICFLHSFNRMKQNKGNIKW